jgi:serine protease AprX
MTSFNPHKSALALVMCIGMTLSLAAQAVVIGDSLQDRLTTLGPLDTVEVIVTFEGEDPLDAAAINTLAQLGLTGVFFQALPMAGVVATPQQVDALAQTDGIRSLWLNEEVVLTNEESRQLTGVDRMRTDPNLRTSMGLPYSGLGIGVVVNDSGVDATHPDLPLGSKVVQNVFGTTNLNAYDSMLPITWVENVPDTDIGSGHGTHVAATIAGTGAASAGRHAGVAPGADLIGYGSGAVVLLLDTVGGFDYALVNQYQYNIRVIQNSWGSPGDTGTPFNPDHPTAVATKMLADRHVITVFSAGNSGPGEDTIGGSYMKAPWIVRVGAGSKDGNLASFSSRGKPGGGGTVVVDGETFEWVDRPTVVGPGVDIISALATTGVLGYLDPKDAFYAYMSGTSMSGPHVAGVVTLMLEANPMLSWREVIEILEATATNMPGRADWEVGAGMVNAHAAVTMAAGMREDYGSTTRLNRDFNASVLTTRLDGPDYELMFDPLLDSTVESFQVAEGLSTIHARANINDNTAAIVLTDPEGNRYGSGISLPLLGPSVAVSAPAMPGEWTIEARGIGALSGVAVDPLALTNGLGLPGTINVSIQFERVDGFEGLNDIEGHPAQGLIERAVVQRLLDSDEDGNFRPDAPLQRIELADYLTLGGGVRQIRPTDGSDSFTGLEGFELAAAEAVSANGGPLRDLWHEQGPTVLPVDESNKENFLPAGEVNRSELAYSLIQSLGMESQAEAIRNALGSSAITVDFGSERVEVVDHGMVPEALRGHVQLALDLNLMRVEFFIDQGPFDLFPTVEAMFYPTETATRAEYALSAVNLLDRLRQ